MPNGSTLYYEQRVGFRGSVTPYLGLLAGAVIVPAPITDFPILSARFAGLTPGTYYLESGAVDALTTTSTSDLKYVGVVDRVTLIVQ